MYKTVLSNEIISAGEPTAYSEPFSFHSDRGIVVLDWIEDSATFAVAVTLWVAKNNNPDRDDDTDWIQVEAVHGFGGLPNGDPAGGSGADFFDLSNANGVLYRLKFAHTTGEGRMTVKYRSMVNA